MITSAATVDPMQSAERPANRVIGWFEPVVRVAAILGGYGIFALAFLVGFEVVARKMFDYSLQGVDEIGGYVIAAMAAFGFGYALLRKVHTRIDIFTSRMPRRLQALLNVLAVVALAGFACFMAWRGLAALSETLEFKSVSSTPLRTPLWIPQTVWVAGLALFAVVSVAVAAHAAWLAQHDPLESLRQYGAKSLEEEIQEERVEVEALDAPGSNTQPVSKVGQ